MATAFQSDAFQNDAFQIDAVADDTDTHDGFRKKPWRQKYYIAKEEVNERAKSYRQYREKLNADIRFAMDGPIEEEVLDVIRSELEPEDFAKFGAPDYEPELKSLLSQTEALRTIARLVMEEEARREEEDIEILLLS